jgi:hypothetical protein
MDRWEENRISKAVLMDGDGRRQAGLGGCRKTSICPPEADYPHSSSLQRTGKYASFLRISDALHLNIFQQPPKMGFSDRLLALRI